MFRLRSAAKPMKRMETSDRALGWRPLGRRMRRKRLRHRRISYTAAVKVTRRLMLSLGR